jgi:prepilin-type N-terminal cleavage/methylation domain-containing protein
VNKRTQRPNGFTLAEVLVTLAIVAVVAAVMIPVLTSQLRKGDANRVTSDLVAVRTGAQAFLSDIRRLPGEVNHLISQPASSSLDIEGNLYGQTLLDRWRGPYLDKQIETGNFVTTGFGGRILSAFDTLTDGGTLWMAAVVEGLTASQFEDVALAIDGDISSSTGKVRFNASNTLRYLMLPSN